MADVVVTAAEVLPTTATQKTQGTAGATITAGQTVYLDSSDNKYKLADADASATTAAVVGIALNNAADGQPLTIAIGGSLDPGFTVTVGTIYVQSGTAGGIAPAADLASLDYVTIIGIGLTAASLSLAIKASGVAVP